MKFGRNAMKASTYYTQYQVWDELRARIKIAGNP
ncbi:hypothetical protein BASH2_00638 [Bacillus anthracis]|nr:hypothetical protein BASH2_00638 [Bacillus anthracis]